MDPTMGSAKSSKDTGVAKSSTDETKSLFGVVRHEEDLKVVEHILLAAEAKYELRNTVNHLGQSLLFFAVQREHDAIEVCKMLLDECQINVAKVDRNGQTALHYLAAANSECSEPCMTFLVIERKCVVDRADGMNQTPLFYAASRGSLGMVRKLLALHADATIKDRRCKSPLCWASCPEKCHELASRCALVGGMCASKPVLISAVEDHQKSGNHGCASYLSACAEVWSLKSQGVLSWLIRRNRISCSVYVTALARPRDLHHLCLLEDDFIKDHKAILLHDSSDLGADDFFCQIGLGADADDRRATIKFITQAQSSLQTEAIRHYTIVCIALPEEAGSRTSPRMPEPIGYIYFKVCDGGKEENARRRPVDLTEEEQSHLFTGFIVISHIKVSSHHQKRGVATLLLASAIKFAEKARSSFKCGALYLSVATRNEAAVALYKKLGFNVYHCTNTQQDGWLNMRQLIVPVELAVIRRRWLELAWADSSAMRAELLQKHVQQMGYVEGNRKRKLTPTDSFASDASTSVGSSASARSVFSSTS